jgi:hypothetical protein
VKHPYDWPPLAFRDPEMRFALEKARDEVSVSVRKANHLQIVAFRAADSRAQ